MLEATTEMNSDFIRADIVLVILHLRNNEYDKALAVAEELAKKRPDIPLAYNFMAAAYAGKKERVKSREQLEKALEISPTFSSAHINLARMDLQDGNVAAARLHYEAVLKNTPDHLGAMLGMANLDEIAGRSSDALTWLKKAHEAHPVALQPGLLLYRQYIATGERLKALQVARTVADANPKSPAAIQALATSQLANDDLRNAIANYEKLVELTPDSAQAYLLLAKAYRRSDNLGKARNAFNQTLEIKQDDIQALVGLVAVEMKSQNMDQAKAIIGTIQSKYPESSIGFQLDGDFLRQAKNHKAAANAYSKAYRRTPSSKLILRMYQSYKLANDEKAALEALERGAKKYPDNADIRLALATEYHLDGRLEEAAQEYERLIELRPDNITAINNLAWIYHEKGDTRARALAAKAYQLAPERPVIVDTYGWVELHSNNTVGGLRAIQDAAVHAPTNPTIRYHLAVALQMNGQVDAARKELERLLMTDSDFPELADAQKLLEKLNSSASHQE
jgi:putative PEP-CTERM system TPR-repeat lipoprotein